MRPSAELEKELEFIETQLKEMLEEAVPQISNILPSDWTEQNMVMKKPFPGPFRYWRTPYTREIIDCLSQSVPVHTIVVMKGAQIGYSSGVIYPALGWIIKNNPGNTLLSVGAPDLISKAMDKIDQMLDACGLRDYISSQTKRRRNNKTGDTNSQKDFANGFIMVNSANNHKNIRQVDFETQFIDDFEAVKRASKESGATDKKLEQRSAAYEETRKRFLISTPEREEQSNIEPAYLRGDQRKFHIPCPCCGEKIILAWAIPSKKNPNRMCGITWGLKENGQLDKSSVGYTCQSCEGFFNDKKKMDWLNKGEWIPTAVAKEEGYRSYHISALYAPIGMYGWVKYVENYIEANPPGQPRDEEKYQVHVNECLGETYKAPGTSIQASALKLNETTYNPGEIPEKLSIAQGNGRIILLEWVADLGGWVQGRGAWATIDDARLDWQLIARTESGSTYSIDHGSIGTFTNAWMGPKDPGRMIWTYDISKPNNVWKEVDKILSAKYKTDTGRDINIHIAGIDTGFADDLVFNYIDTRQGRFPGVLVGLKGDKEYQYMPIQDNSPIFKSGNRPMLYSLNVNKLKDMLSQRITLRWNKAQGELQPPGFMNFPQPRDGKYSLEGFFLHYEAEERRINKDNKFIWEKKGPTVQNHFFDTDIYGAGCTEILMRNIFKDYKQEHQIDYKEGTWTDLCRYLLYKWGLSSMLGK